MSQVSYGTITITDTTDIESIYMIYKGGDNNETPPSITWTGGQVDWTTDITTVEGNYIWAITVYKKSGIAITQQNYQEYFSDPVCLTGSIGRSVRSISTYYCNYGNGRPEENYTGWSNTVPVYDEEKPNYWIKTVIIYVDSTEEIITGEGTVVTLDLGDKVGIAESLKVALEPIQDLHGYDHPWVGGAGKNLLDAEYAIKFTLNKTITLPKAISANSRIYIHSDGYSYTTPPSSGLKYPYYVFRDSNGNNCGAVWGYRDGGLTLSADAVAIQLWSNGYDYAASTGVEVTINGLTISLEEQSSWTPYSNICPISGRTEVVTHRTGKNLLPNDSESYTLGNTYRYITRIMPDGVRAYMSFADKDTSVDVSDISIGFIHGYSGGSVSLFRWCLNDGTVADHSNIATVDTSILCEGIFIYPRTEDAFNRLFARYDIMVELGTTATDYEPYQGETYTTALGQTVYGGTLDVVSGELVVTHGYVDLGTLSWSKNGTRMQATLDDSAVTGFNYNVICSQYVADEAIAVANPTKDGIMGRYQARILIYDSRYTDPTAFKTAMNGVQLCYELANPQTIQLTPQEVQLLLGTNNVWSEDGEVEISSFTIAGQDVTIYKDNGLTEAVSKSFEASSKAQEALDKANIAQGKVTQIDTLLGGHFLWHGTALSSLTKAGARVVEQVKNGATDVSDTPSQWHHNVNIGADGIQLRYNEAVMAQLAANQSSGNTALKFYRPPTISGSTTTQGTLAMELTSGALNFYGSSTSTPDATLSSTGLNLTKGSITLGNYFSVTNTGVVTAKSGIIGGWNFTDAALYYSNATPGYSTTNLVISKSSAVNTNAIADSETNKHWFLAAGRKFGVDTEGNLYANNAHLSSATVEGAITATSLTISSGGTTYSGVSAINANGYSIQIIEDKSAAYSGATMGDNNTYLYPILFLNGVKVESGIVYTNFIWFLDGATTGGTQGHSSNGGIVAEYGHTYRVTYSVDDTAVGEAQPSTYINVDPSKYITRIANNGITVHPETMAANSNYIHIDGNSLMVKRQVGTTAAVSTDTILASFGTTAQIGQNGSSRFLMNSDSLQAYDINNNLYFEVNSNGLTWGSNTAATTTQVNTAAQTATNFIKTDGSGIKVQNSSDATDYVYIGSNKISLYRNDIEKLQLTDSLLRLGDTSNYVNLDTNGMGIFKSNSQVAFFSDTAINIGKLSSSSDLINSGISLNVDEIPVFEVTTQYGNQKFMRFGDISIDRIYYDGEQYTPGNYSIAFGNHTMATGEFALAEGCFTSARGHRSHAEGCTTLAGCQSHPIFSSLTGFAHAEGHQTQAWGDCSHAQNESTIAAGNCQTAIGRYNEQDTTVTSSNPYGTYAFMIGNGYYTGSDWNWASASGLSPSQQGYGPYKNQLTKVNNNMTFVRRNAFTVDWSGNIRYSGSAASTSDRRLKDHQSYLSIDAVKFIRNLKPAHFIKDNAHHVGFYAQDVEEVDPWNCMTGEMNGFKTLGYTEIIAPLVAYCQHLEERIQQLEEK